ncbi:MAG TPA: phosphate acyltransferase PlsX [Acidimicrobiia bacterium]|jgi:glycerol-3-phosphate acyltransferase PlsX
MARIALDAMGGDHAPDEIVAGGAVAAAHGVEVVLVGDTGRVGPLAEEHGFTGEIVDAGEVVEMGDDPGRAIREKPDSSVAVAARLVREGKVDGFVSAGSTGAAMASAAIIVGRIEGVLRPTIASIFPTPTSPTVMLDSGANPEVKPEHLLQFAEMGAAMAEIYFGADRARVGLLNIGEEKSKGRPLDRAAYELLERSALNFIGNVEGRDIATATADVIVTDGFTGNVFLKTVEGAAVLINQLILEQISDLDPELKQALMPALINIKDRLDYESVGGAHLIGTEGVVVIAHGSSKRRAIANAVQMAADGAERGLVQRVRELITA